MSIWNSLKFSAGSAGVDLASNISYRYIKKKDGNLIYKNNRGYKSLIVYIAKRTAAQYVEQKVNTLFPKYQRYLENQLRDTVLKQQDANLKKLIEAGERVDKGLGFIEIPGHRIIAKNKYGDQVPEALMVYYESDKDIDVQDVVYQNGKAVKTSYKTNVVCFIDLTASVSMQSAKNLVLTQVQGRDFTRKELVSGGDLTFSVTGKIVGNDRGVYPENDVKKFVQLAQYGGVIKVNHFLFRQFNIEQIIIKEFNLNTSDCKNVQPYTFTCVAVEPDEDVSIIADTIGVLNAEIAISPMNKWYKLILNNKLTSIVANTAANSVSSLAAGGLDALVPNI
ncbi:DUF6046 domain-containing protein [Bacteroides sp. 224]|uniref:DUF6046 domain-containing protein n=1 Tax=Bacteroides sp. 224 TaxID=2302936 RepID=UPI0013D60D39|nr:DUF6046 domain-containing protein [Bacteroides sp. 224]NDV63946.1 hypothetical protein [Bacteroides sp. 224]